MQKAAYLLVNFGGPRDLEEIEEFLIALLTDQEVIRTPFPAFFHRWLFTRVAKKRTHKVAPDYAMIGGKSPIFEDTQAIAASVGQKLGQEVLTFHRYLPKTHSSFLEQLHALADVDEIRIFPLFPQFSYATTGSIALWLTKHISKSIRSKMRWVKSYPDHPGYIATMEATLRSFLEAQNLREEETILLFSAHGLPKRFIDTGDPYQVECQRSFDKLRAFFPKALSYLSYQSQFGKEEWIRPYTQESCEQITSWGQGRQKAVVIPLSFTSDHIETLYEIEKLYLPVIRKRGIEAYRCPALGRREDWLTVIADMFKEEKGIETSALLR